MSKSSSASRPLLEVSSLTITDTRRNACLVDRLSFEISAGEVFGLVGESGSGKSLTALALMRLLPSWAEIAGQVVFEGTDLLAQSERRMRSIRGGRIGMIFQDPTSALNPVFTIGDQLSASIRAHRTMTAGDVRRRAIELLDLVRIPDPTSRLSFYPHELSGGMCQRIMIALALAGGAALLIADEPTTALDVTIQDSILRLLEDLVATTGVSMLFISHDLGVISRLCSRVSVIYSGQIVETGGSAAILHRPSHPYTRGLVRCVPDGSELGVIRRGIPGAPPSAGSWPAGCRFEPRCEFALPHCKLPQLLQPVVLPQHAARCWRVQDGLPPDPLAEIQVAS
jgi:oligopeptide/dipeptide ABC transporter ATP-binding protein